VTTLLAALTFLGAEPANGHADGIDKLRPLAGTWNCIGYWFDEKDKIVSASSDTYAFSARKMTLTSVDSVPRNYSHQPLTFAADGSGSISVSVAHRGASKFLGKGVWTGADFQIRWKHSTSTLKFLNEKAIEFSTPWRIGGRSRKWIEACER
jgi:hypothetical protein